jgi:acetyl-CoA acetyltransferase
MGEAYIVKARRTAGTNVARNAVLASKLPESVPGTLVDRQCGSSQQAIHFAAATVMPGMMDVVIAAGVESMTRVPMALPFKAAMDAGAAAATAHAFANEIVAVPGLDGDNNPVSHTVDEGIRFEATLETTKSVKLLSEQGRLTAATSSQICDGASGVLVMNEAGLKELGVDPARLNVNGGAIALGHPLGASGSKLMATLVHALHARGGRYGLQTMCEGGGLANVTIIERL